MSSVQRLRELAISDSGFVFDPQTGSSFSVNQTGRFILERLKRGVSGETVAEDLRASFDTRDADLTRDVGEFLRLLTEQGILHDGEFQGGKPEHES